VIDVYSQTNNDFYRLKIYDQKNVVKALYDNGFYEEALLYSPNNSLYQNNGVNPFTCSLGKVFMNAGWGYVLGLGIELATGNYDNNIDLIGLGLGATYGVIIATADCSNN
jgi:hypothetical protein